MRTNSTIKTKIDNCVDCPEDHPKQAIYSAGRCEFHYWKHRTEEKAKKGTGRVSPHITDYRARTVVKTSGIEGMSQWYEDRRKEMTGVCIETGKASSKNSDAFFRWSICHILPKKEFPSVATHPDNWMELNIESHTLYDRNWMTASKMKCIEVAKEKFKKFEPFIAQEERKRIPEIFLT
jgi:hypothetical protein